MYAADIAASELTVVRKMELCVVLRYSKLGNGEEINSLIYINCFLIADDIALMKHFMRETNKYLKFELIKWKG